MMTACTRCHKSNPGEARFCMHCGQALSQGEATPGHQPAAAAPATPSGEHRIVTVLFADIAGSTRLAESLGAEPWHDLLSEFFAALTAVIEGWGGTVNQYTGDGLMSLFGAPRALEDHALRACHAALNAQQRLEALGDRVRLEYGQNFGVRIGLNSGPVVVGAIADDWRRDYTAQGATVHLAARMEQMARPGSVFVAEATSQQAEGYFNFRHIGPTQVKGMERSVVVAELQSAGPMRQRLERSQQRGLSPLVGRKAAIDALQACWEDAREGRSGIALLQGDAGLGKSRLCMEMLARWQSDGAANLRCAATSHGDAQAMAPIKTMLLNWLGVAADADQSTAKRAVAGTLALEHSEMSDALPVLLDFLDIEPDLRSAGMPPDARRRQLDGLHEQFCKAFCGRRVLLWIDDWHWLDAATLSYLEKWLPHLMHDAQVLILVTTRPTELPGWLQNLQPRQIPLLPLAESDMCELVQQLLGDWVLGHTLGRQLVAHAEGNPYFVEEAIAHLLERGVLKGPMGHRELSDDQVELSLPQSVQSLLAARLDSVEPDARKLLEAAALIGREFTARWIGVILEREEKQVAAELHRLADLGFVFQQEACSNWCFMHGLLQEVALQLQLVGQRRLRHRKLAAWLADEIKAGNLPAKTWPQVGQHYAAAEDWLAAAQANLVGGIEVGRLTTSEGLRLLLLAREQLSELPDEKPRDQLEFQILTALLRGATFYRTDPEQVKSWMDHAQNYVQRYDDKRGQVELWMSTGTIALNGGDAEQAVAQIQRSVRLACEIGEEVLLARFRVPILFAHLARGDVRGGLSILDVHQGAVWHSGPMTADNYMSRGFRSLLLGAAGQVDAAIEELKAAIRYCEEEAIPVSWMYANLVEFRLFQGDRVGVLELAQHAVRVAAEFGSPVFDELANRALAQAMLDSGDARGALQLMQQWTAAVGPGMTGEIFAAAHHEVLAIIADAAGEAALAAAAVETAISTAEAKGQQYWLARALLARLRIGVSDDRQQDVARVLELIEITGAEGLREDVARVEARVGA